MDCRVNPGNDVLTALVLAITVSYFSSHRPCPHRGFELVAELGEFVGGEIADRPVVQSPLAPAPDIESLDGVDPGGVVFGTGGLGHEQIDHMGAPAVDDGADRVGVDIIEPA